MAAEILLGAPIAEGLHQRIRERMPRVTPTLAIVDATGDEAAARFARAKIKACERLGLEARHHPLPPSGAADDLLELLQDLSEDPQVHAILLESPLPAEYRPLNASARIPPEKDVEGLHPYNLGRLFTGSPLFVPATAAACLEMLRHHEVSMAGRHAVVVGRSTVVGRPAALLLLAEDATVTLCHSRTRDLAEHTRRADILLVAAGRAELVKADMVAPGAVVLDVGTNVTPAGHLVGDVDFAGVSEVASALTPARGGIGPVTTALLLWNTVEAARLQAAARSVI